MVRSLAVALPYYFGGLHNLQSMLLPKKLVGFTPPPLKIADHLFHDVKHLKSTKKSNGNLHSQNDLIQNISNKPETRFKL